MNSPSQKILAKIVLLFFLIFSVLPFPAAARSIPWSLGKAPSFRSGLEWLNAVGPLNLQDLKGKFVILDFWTYACINCMHVLPDLQRLEKKYSKELVVIGVHSAKFSEERETRNIREAVLRYGIKHPVINDNRLEMWRDYGIDSWPTAIVIDPLGNIIARHSGEGIFESLDKAIQSHLKDYAYLIDRAPVFIPEEKDTAGEAILKFPGKLLVDMPRERLFIADSGHHRIIVANLTGKVTDVIGGTRPGRADGDFTEAQFGEPQGMAINGETLYIADRSNHLIRKADLSTRQVMTIAGTGKQGQERRLQGPALRPALSMNLNSPWDVAFFDGILYIAMAGNHQIWALNPETGEIQIFAGSGREGLEDGPLLESALAQPSGLVSDGNLLYVADSEVSGVRQIPLSAEGEVKTLIGKGLFQFGDKDGDWDQARLQHPLGIAASGSFLAIADTFNNKIKRLDLEKKTILTLAGTGENGNRDGPLKSATFNEPSGLSFGSDKIFVADTNNHRVRIIDLAAGMVSTLALRGLEPSAKQAVSPENFTGERISVSSPISSDLHALNLMIKLPPFYKLLDKAPSQARLFTKGAEIKKFPIRQEQETVPIDGVLSGDKVYLELNLYYCRQQRSSVCLFKNVLYDIPLKKNSRLKNLTILYQIKD